MKKLLCVIRYKLLVKIFFFSLITLHCSLFTAASAATVEEAVARIEKKYSDIQDMQGNFLQTSIIKDLDRIEKYEGKFFIKKPSNIKWVYSQPRDEEVTIRDRETWIYKKSDKQVLKTTFSKSAYNQVPIALLGSLGSLNNDFDITIINENTLKLTPRHKMGFIKKIFIETNSGDFPVKTITMHDIHNNQIIIAVNNVKINPGLTDSFFVFKAPSDVEVFDLDQ